MAEDLEKKGTQEPEESNQDLEGDVSKGGDEALEQRSGFLNVTYEDEDADLEDYDEDDDQGGDSEPYLSQTETQKLIDRKFAEWNIRREKELKDMFGTQDLGQVREGYMAGNLIAQAGRVSPAELIRRFQQMQKQQQPGSQGQSNQPQANQPSDELQQQIAQLTALVMGQQQEEQKQTQEKEARAEFGDALYEANALAIQEKAEQTGLTLAEAAAVVLRPQLKGILKDQVQKSQAQKSRKRVDKTTGKPASRREGAESLPKELRDLAKSYGMDPEEYYKLAKQTGLIEE